MYHSCTWWKKSQLILWRSIIWKVQLDLWKYLGMYGKVCHRKKRSRMLNYRKLTLSEIKLNARRWRKKVILHFKMDKKVAINQLEWENCTQSKCKHKLKNAVDLRKSLKMNRFLVKAKVYCLKIQTQTKIQVSTLHKSLQKIINQFQLKTQNQTPK